MSIAGVQSERCPMGLLAHRELGVSDRVRVLPVVRGSATTFATEPAVASPTRITPPASRRGAGDVARAGDAAPRAAWRVRSRCGSRPVRALADTRSRPSRSCLPSGSPNHTGEKDTVVMHHLSSGYAGCSARDTRGAARAVSSPITAVTPPVTRSRSSSTSRSGSGRYGRACRRRASTTPSMSSRVPTRPESANNA
jgi:hypothetical protein